MWGDEKCIRGFGRETRGKRENLEDQDVNGRIILKCMFKNWDGGPLDWIDLTQDSDRGKALANAVMNLQGP